jgi:hypothetical protein
LSHIDLFTKRFENDLERVFGNRAEDVQGRLRESLFTLYGMAFGSGRAEGMKDNESNRKAFIMGYDTGARDQAEGNLRFSRAVADEMFGVLNIEAFEE